MQTSHSRKHKLMASFAVSTHVTESAVLHAAPEDVWARLSSLNFSWWNLVSSSVPTEGGNSSTVGSLFNVGKSVCYFPFAYMSFYSIAGDL